MILNKFLTASLLAFTISTGANVIAHANTIFNTSNYIPCTSLAKSQSSLGTNTVSGFTDNSNDHQEYVKINGQGWISSKNLKYQPAICLKSKADALSGYFSVVEQGQQPVMTYYISNNHLASLFSLAAKLWKPTGVKITRTQKCDQQLENVHE